jgi:hypothetical protein
MARIGMCAELMLEGGWVGNGPIFRCARLLDGFAP